MPKTNSSETNRTARRAQASGNEDSTSPHADSSVIGAVPLVPAHRELLRETRSTIPRPYIPSTVLLEHTLRRLLPQAGGELEEPPQPSNQEPQPTSEWSHSRVRVATPVTGSQDTDTSNNPPVCVSFHPPNHIVQCKARVQPPSGV